MKENVIGEQKKISSFNRQDEKGQTCLHRAAAYWLSKDKWAYHVPLLEGADPNIPDNNGDTPFHLYCSSSLSTLEGIEFFLFYKANINALNNNQSTPLGLACYHRVNDEVIRFLLDRKADPTLQNNEGVGSFDYYIDAESVSLETVVLFFEKGSDINAQNRNKKTALHLYLNTEVTDQGIKFFINNKADFNIQDDFGNTPLHLICEKKKENFLPILLEGKANPNIKNKQDNTPFSIACEKKLSTKTIELFFEYKADPNVKNKDNLYPFYFICEAGNYESAQIFINNKIKLKDYDSKEKSLLKAVGDPRLLRLLLEEGVEYPARNERGRTLLADILFITNDRYKNSFASRIMTLAEPYLSHITVLLEHDQDIAMPSRVARSFYKKLVNAAKCYEETKSLIDKETAMPGIYYLLTFMWIDEYWSYTSFWSRQSYFGKAVTAKNHYAQFYVLQVAYLMIQDRVAVLETVGEIKKTEQEEVMANESLEISSNNISDNALETKTKALPSAQITLAYGWWKQKFKKEENFDSYSFLKECSQNVSQHRDYFFYYEKNLQENKLGTIKKEQAENLYNFFFPKPSEIIDYLTNSEFFYHDDNQLIFNNR